MTLTIDLSPEQEAQFAAVARTKGIDPAELAKKLLTEYLPSTTRESEQDPTLALFTQWETEDAQMTPDEIAEENRTWEDFKTNINAERDRAGARRVF